MPVAIASVIGLGRTRWQYSHG